MSSPLRQYKVIFKGLSGEVLSSFMLSTSSPRQALYQACRQQRQVVTYSAKYGSWPELQRAAVALRGSCRLCEVVSAHGKRKNFYSVFTQPMI